MATALTAITDVLGCVAEMEDGEILIGCTARGHDATHHPLWRVTTRTRQRLLAHLGSESMWQWTAEVEPEVLPVSASYAVALHPAGWALVSETHAVATTSTYTLLRRSGPTWSTVAQMVSATSGDYWNIAAVGAALYVVRAASVWELRGSALVEYDTDAPANSRAYRELSACVRDYYQANVATRLSVTMLAGSVPHVARWRGHWWGVLEGEDGVAGVGYWDGQSAVVLMPGIPQWWMVVAAGATSLELLGVMRWHSLQQGTLRTATITDLQFPVAGGSASRDCTWSLGYSADGDGFYIYREKVLVSISQSREYDLALMELRMYAGSDPTADSPELAEIRMHTFDAAWGAGGLQELRMWAGSDPTATSPRLMGMEMIAGSDPTADSPVLEELRQYALPPVPPSPELAALRQYALGQGPRAGDVVRYLLDTDTARAASAVQVTTGQGLTEEAGLQVLVRADREDLDPDVWSSYQALRAGYQTELGTPGHVLRFAIIKAAAADVPDVGIQVRREAE